MIGATWITGAPKVPGPLARQSEQSGLTEASRKPGLSQAIVFQRSRAIHGALQRKHSIFANYVKITMEYYDWDLIRTPTSTLNLYSLRENYNGV